MSSAPTQDEWASLQAELALWRTAGRRARLWLRDDDATAPSPALDRLLRITASQPILLAVIPEQATEALAARLRRTPAVSVIQHGWRHRMNARDGEKKSEFPPSRDPAEGVAALRRGREKLEALFGAQFQPILAPPWNRLSDKLAARLPEAGIAGLSRFHAAPAQRPNGAPGLTRIDVDIDIIDWRGGRGGKPATTLVGEIVAKLAWARKNDPAVPVGVMTHHLVHDETAWRFLERLFEQTRRDPGAVWVNPFHPAADVTEARAAESLHDA